MNSPKDFVAIFTKANDRSWSRSKIKSLLSEKTTSMKHQITTFLTFQENNAERAMNFYVALFDNAEILEIQRHEKGGPAQEGSIKLATFQLNGKEFMCSDSYVKHQWTFTPAVSMFVECKTENEIEDLHKKLSANGKVFMELDNYGFSQRFSWVEDGFGISWQLNLR